MCLVRVFFFFGGVLFDVVFLAFYIKYINF